MATRDFIKDPLRVITTFSGYDSQAMALERIKQNFDNFDYDLVRWCEIDQNAIKAHDLCFAPAKHEGWINLYRSDSGGYALGNGIYFNKEQAEEMAVRTCVATVKIEWEE